MVFSWMSFPVKRPQNLSKLYQRAKVYHNSQKGIQQSLLLDKLDSDLIEISFWARIASDDSSIAERQELRCKLRVQRVAK